MRKSLSGSGPRKSLSGDSSRMPGLKGIDGKKIKLMAISVVIGSIILLTIALIVIAALGNKGPAATPTPVPDVTPSPTASPTATPAPTVTPVPTPSAGQVFNTNGPFYMRAILNGNSGQCVVSLKLDNGAPSVDVTGLSMSVVCDGQTYDKVWTLKSMDWNNANGNNVLEADENIATILDTVKLGIPQSKPMTIKVIKDGNTLQEISVAPTYS